MDLDSLETKRRFPLALQLAPMIDIFFLIIIFLLKSTIVADVSIVFPGQMHPPISKSTESLETFPEIVLDDSQLIIGVLDSTVSITDIEKMTEEELLTYKGKVEAYVKEKDVKIRDQAVNVNLITARDNNYKNVFQAVKFLRKIGFQSVVFIAEGESK